MKKATAEQLAAFLIDPWTQSRVEHDLPLGDDGYYVLATRQSRPIAELHRFDCDEFSDEADALEMMGEEESQ